MDTMRAVIYHGPKRLRLETVPIPRPGPGELLLEVGGALTCGTDFKAYRQGHPVLLGEPPAPFGHELAGTVAEVGAGVARFRPGMRVVAANSAPCDRCFFCARSQPQLCDNLKLHNGAYAEFNLLPANIVKHNVYELAPGLPFEAAALSEPLSCAIHGVDALQVAPGETAAILGAGIMSRLLLSALKARGAFVVVVGRSPEPLAAMRALGADAAVSALETDPVEAVRRFSGGRGVDHAFEAVGKAETWRQSIAMARKGGKVCLFGGCAQGTAVPMDAHRIHYSQISLFGVFHHTPRYFRSALELITQGKVDVRSLIQDSIGLDDVPAYFEAMHDRSNLKVAVLP